MRVNLSRMPSPPKEYVLDFPRLDGGLNTRELEYRLNANESPDMVNLWWKDGALCSRDGQVRITGAEPLGTGWSACGQLFWDNGFFHIGDGLWHTRLDGGETAEGSVELTRLISGVPENRGTWFRYGGGLYYKNRGGYFVITRDEAGIFSASAVEGYTPVIQINTDPGTGAGDTYQPENRISPRKTVRYSTVKGVREYHLPVEGADGVERVAVDGVTLAEGTDYTVDLAAGTVTFATEPAHHDPVRVNTVEITYTKENADAMASVMDCPCATVYGGEQNVLVVVGGCEAQPNAYFWSGSHSVMDPGYFPMEQYNLAGDAGEKITGFGRQQSMLVVFKERSVGRAAMSAAEMGSGRVLITLNYTPINSSIGCDLPGSIQTVENNLVFCSTVGGVYLLKDSTSAHENNVVSISRKVNRGLLEGVRSAETVISCDDGSRYWLAADGEVYLWDYSLSGYGDPVWFRFTDIPAAAFLTACGRVWHLDDRGRVTVMRGGCRDYGGAIHKRYRFAARNMGSYDRLKDVIGVAFVVRGDTDTVIDVTYETDWERRRDAIPIRSWTWRMFPRDLAYRCLSFRRFATVARRRTCCSRVRHFAMELENNIAGMDLAVISAQIFYRFQGRER